MKTTQGKYILSMNIELTPEQVAAILENQIDIVDTDIGSHAVIGHLRDFVAENIDSIANRLANLDNSPESSTYDTLNIISPLFKERKIKK